MKIKPVALSSLSCYRAGNRVFVFLEISVVYKFALNGRCDNYGFSSSTPDGKVVKYSESFRKKFYFDSQAVKLD